MNAAPDKEHLTWNPEVVMKPIEASLLKVLWLPSIKVKGRHL